jgi:hypothetical protein
MSRGAGRGNITIDSIAEENQAITIYESGTMIYVCKAGIGASLSASEWQIKRVDTSSGVIIKWANGNDLYNNTATDLATVAGHSYS